MRKPAPCDQAASMGSLLLAAGNKDMRFALPNARIMLHQPSGGFQGQATDIMLHAQEILNLKKRSHRARPTDDLRSPSAASLPPPSA